MSLTKIAAGWLIVGLLVGGIVGYGVGYLIYAPQISQLQSDVTSLQEQINTLNSTLLDTQEELMPGRVPILTIGDWWTVEFDQNGTTYTLTTNVTGEGTDYYVLFYTYDPPYVGEINGSDWIDKSTLNPIRMQGQGNYTYDTRIIPYTFSMTILYTYEGGVIYPLIVGKELNITQNMISNITMEGVTSSYIMNSSFIVKVETIENVTVSAGTFTCFRINMLNATSGDPFYTGWYSDEVKNYVKYVDYSTTPETTSELEAYLVQ